MAQIEKRSKGFYRITVWLPRSPGSNKRNYEREYFKGKLEDAKTRGREMEEECKSGIVQRSRSMTVDQFLDQWLRIAVTPRVKPRTLNDYTDLLKRYVRPTVGALKMADLEPLSIQQVYSKMQEDTLSSRTVRYVHTVLNNALQQAVRWRMVKYNAADGADLPKASRRVIHPLTEEQVPELLKAAKESEYYCLFLFAVTTGLRPEEYLAIEWSSIDLEARTVRVSRALVWERPGKSWSFGEPKTRKGERTVPLPSMTVEALKMHQRAQMKARLKSGKWPDLNLVFCTSLGGPIDPGNLGTRHFKPLLEPAQLPKATRLYDLRHTWVTLSLAAGVSPKTVSEWAGHASVAFTLDTYAHLIPSMERAGAAQIEVMFNGIMRSNKNKRRPVSTDQNRAKKNQRDK